MTTLKRRAPKPLERKVDKRVWPSLTITGRITDDGRVAGHPSGPAGALWEEALGRWNAVEDGNLDWDEGVITQGEVKGLVIGLSVLTCMTVDEIYARLAELRKG